MNRHRMQECKRAARDKQAGPRYSRCLLCPICHPLFSSLSFIDLATSPRRLSAERVCRLGVGVACFQPADSLYLDANNRCCRFMEIRVPRRYEIGHYEIIGVVCAPRVGRTRANRALRMRTRKYVSTWMEDSAGRCLVERVPDSGSRTRNSGKRLLARASS